MLKPLQTELLNNTITKTSCQLFSLFFLLSKFVTVHSHDPAGALCTPDRRLFPNGHRPFAGNPGTAGAGSCRYLLSMLARLPCDSAAEYKAVSTCLFTDILLIRFYIFTIMRLIGSRGQLPPDACTERCISNIPLYCGTIRLIPPAHSRMVSLPVLFFLGMLPKYFANYIPKRGVCFENPQKDFFRPPHTIYQNDDPRFSADRYAAKTIFQSYRYRDL